LTNGLVGTIKTIVTELAPSEEIEEKMMGMVVGMRAWGFLISPAVGGWLAEPIKEYHHC
jgi:MFS family permease